MSIVVPSRMHGMSEVLASQWRPDASNYRFRSWSQTHALLLAACRKLRRKCSGSECHFIPAYRNFRIVSVRKWARPARRESLFSRIVHFHDRERRRHRLPSKTELRRPAIREGKERRRESDTFVVERRAWNSRGLLWMTYMTRRFDSQALWERK